MTRLLVLQPPTGSPTVPRDGPARKGLALRRISALVGHTLHHRKRSPQSIVGCRAALDGAQFDRHHAVDSSPLCTIPIAT
jgi:hypothetical protein